jgi:hypothetical protein
VTTLCQKELIMLLSVNDTIGYTVQAEDSDVGKLDDLLFHDATSKIRYLVVDAGSWLSARKVLLAPAAVGQPDPEARAISTVLNQQQVKDSPPIDTDKPVSHQQEEALHGHFGWTPYWYNPLLGAPAAASPYWGSMPVLPDAPADPAAAEEAMERGDPHLRSAAEVIGYYVGAEDGDIGHVEDLLIAEDDWTLRYLVIDTRNWLPGKKVLIATDWLKSVDWPSGKIAVDLARERIKTSPEYDPNITLDRAHEESLYRHYGRDALWL